MTPEENLPPVSKASLQEAIRRLVRAEIADSWKGGGYPEDIPIIEEDLRRARIRVSGLLTRIFQK